MGLGLCSSVPPLPLRRGGLWQGLLLSVASSRAQGPTAMREQGCVCARAHREVWLRAAHPSCCPDPGTPGAPRKAKWTLGGQERGCFRAQRPEPTARSSSFSNWASRAPAPKLPHPNSPTYMTPSLVFSAASVTPCLVFSTAPTTPSLAMEKPFLKTSMVVAGTEPALLQAVLELAVLPQPLPPPLIDADEILMMQTLAYGSPASLGVGQGGGREVGGRKGGKEEKREGGREGEE